MTASLNLMRSGARTVRRLRNAKLFISLVISTVNVLFLVSSGIFDTDCWLSHKTSVTA